jgi:hypothetical protein
MGLGPREGPSPDTTLHCVSYARPRCCESAHSHRSLRPTSKIWSLEPPKGASAMKRCSALDTSSLTVAMHLGVWPEETSTLLGSVSLQSRGFSPAAAEKTTLQNIVFAVSGKKQRWLLQSESKGSAAERLASPNAGQRPNHLQLSLLQTGETWPWLESRCPRQSRRQGSGYAQSYIHFIRLRKTDQVHELSLQPNGPPDSGGGTAILVRRGIDDNAVPVSGLQHLEATAIHLVLATRPVKLVTAYLSPTRPLIESDISEFLSGGFPVLMAGDLNAKHTDWNSRRTAPRGSLLRDYAIRTPA